MKVNEAIAIMNSNSTMAELMDAETTFRNAGLKGLLNKVQSIIGQRLRPAVPEVSPGHFAEAILTDLAFDRIRKK